MVQSLKPLLLEHLPYRIFVDSTYNLEVRYHPINLVYVYVALILETLDKESHVSDVWFYLAHFTSLSLLNRETC